jgi:hypothetical protein
MANGNGKWQMVKVEASYFERMDEAVEYCREVESYLCKKNAGHLIRIVGPAFDQVKGWAAQGIPLKIVFRGIDATCERHNAKPGRRRPLRIEFCEADILKAFDDWRRAMGAFDATEEVPPSRKEPLASHIERTVQRLLAVRTSGSDTAVASAIAKALATLDQLVTNAREARGDARAAIISRLAELDAGLIAAARSQLDVSKAEAIRREAEADLAPFAARMSHEDHRRASSTAFDRLLRESLALPTLTYE